MTHHFSLLNWSLKPVLGALSPSWDVRLGDAHLPRPSLSVASKFKKFLGATREPVETT